MGRRGGRKRSARTSDDGRMIRSMTGFGAADRETREAVLSVEIRTENHRHFHSHFRVPAEAERLEPELTRILRDGLARGHIRFRLHVEPRPDVAPPLEIDHGRLRSLADALAEIEWRYVRPQLPFATRLWRNLFGGPKVQDLLVLGDVLKPISNSLELDSEALFDATREALDRVVEAREREGEALRTDLLNSLDAIDAALNVVLERAPSRLEEERDRMREAVKELLGEDGVDDERIAKEIAFLAERWDINEELVRLRSHLDEFRQLLEADGAEPVGKRLGFWVQEMLREANTIGSKANDSEIARQVVEIKTAIEQIREQVENVE